MIKNVILKSYLDLKTRSCLLKSVTRPRPLKITLIGYTQKASPQQNLKSIATKKQKPLTLLTSPLIQTRNQDSDFSPPY